MIPTALRSTGFLTTLSALALVALGGCSGAEPEAEPEPTTVIVTPGSASFDAVGKTRSFVAAVQDQNGDPLPLAPVTWSSSASDVVTVDASGTVTAVSNGTAFIRATAGSASGSAAVAVEQVAGSIGAAGGGDQVGAAGTTLPTPLRVRVADVRGNPAEGVAVRYEVAAGEGSVTTDGGSPGVHTARTDAQGVAEARWRLGPEAGAAQEVEARVPGTATGTVRFEAVAVAGPPADMRVLRGQAQSAARLSTLPATILVRVADAFDNPVPAAPVDFEVLTGGGTADPAATQADAQGRAETSWTLGATLGTQTLQASSGGAEVTVQATATVVPTDVAIAAGDGQSATAGEPVAIPPAVRVTDAGSLPAAGVPVSFSVIGGGGTLAGPAAVTDANGIAAVGGWTLGETAGPNTLMAEVEGLAPVTFSATGTAGPAAALSKVDGDDQSGPIATPLPGELVVRVDDRFGNPVPGSAVAFEITGGGGSLSQSSVTTGEDGRAGVSWSLGPFQGVQTARARAAGREVVFTATATAVPAAMSPEGGEGQTATVNTAVAQPPAVRLVTAGAEPVAGAVVSFSVSSGGGVVVGGGATGGSVAVQTGADGIAALDAWVLGTQAGILNQSVTASTTGVDDVVFTASAEADEPAVFAKVSGGGQSGEVGATLDDPVVVRVADRYGNVIVGAEVGFSVSQGSVSPGAADTDATGRASAVWTLGAGEGTQQLVATLLGSTLPSLTFSATATAPGGDPECAPAAVQSGFDIELCYLTPVSASVESAFENAAARWGQLITGDLPERTTTLGTGSCGSGSPEVSGTIDDLLIFVTVEAVDGQFGILGSAGPCQVRFGGSTAFPFAGRMRFDEADMDRLEADGQLEEVILHEMGHVLGIGTLWDFGPYDFLKNPVQGTPDPGADTHFDGPQAIAAFDAAGGAGRTVDSKVPVENAQGGGGTLDGHWRESTMDDELMTGFLDGGRPNPLSAITVASLADLGYVVNTGAADPYTVTNPDGAPPRHGGRGRVELVDDILRLPIYLVNAEGEVVGVITPR